MFGCFIDQQKCQKKVWHCWNVDLTETENFNIQTCNFTSLNFYDILGKINLCYFNLSRNQSRSRLTKKKKNPLGGGNCHKGHMFDN